MAEQVVQQTARIVDELLILFHESMRYQADEKVRAALSDACARVRRIRRRIGLLTDRYIVAVVGLTNVGKSTLLNALLGAELTPRRNRPCTAVPIEFGFGPQWLVTAHYRRRVHRDRWPCESSDAVRRCLENLADDEAEPSRREISRLVVNAPIDLLENGLVIADTPGFGAAQADEQPETHDEVLTDYLKNNTAQVFWVVLADQGIGKREKAFYDRFLADVCDDIVVTGCEDWEPDERQRFRRRFAPLFTSPQFHFVSGLQGLRGRQEMDPQRFEAAGIPLLEQRIRELSSSPGRLAAVESALCNLATDVRDWLEEFRDARGFKLARWWRPDSWSRWIALLPENQLKNDLSPILKAP
uniref:Dynamin N-terminal domain-containing protein n=1 Tax=Schlesneria paludicola TaxID=360056 RepID=A0A7C4LPX3_9PLAN